MPKKICDNQENGNIGESEFQAWATKLGWNPSKFMVDLGFDFVCNLRGERITETTSVIPGNIFGVSVRSTTHDSDTVIINRSDADLFLSTTVPVVLAIVKRAPIDQAGQIAIKFIDENFVPELIQFLSSPNETHTLHFSAAIQDVDKIRNNIDDLFKEPYHDMIAKLRIEMKFKGILDNPIVETAHTVSGPYAYVHSREYYSLTELNKKVNVSDISKEIGFKVVFTAASLSTAGVLLRKDALNHLPGEYLPTGLTSKYDVQRLMIQIEQELELLNYNTAYAMTDEIENSIKKIEGEISEILPEIFFLIARISVIRAERKDDNIDKDIAKAKELVSRVELLPVGSVSNNLIDDLKALRCAIDNLEERQEHALSRLATLTNAYAVRIQISILLNRHDIDEAISIIEGREFHIKWCDLAVAAFASKGRIDDALRCMEWVAAQDNRIKYQHCAIRLADILFVNMVGRHEKGKPIIPNTISDEDKKDIKLILKILKSILNPIKDSKIINSELSAIAVKIAWQTNYLLGNRDEVAILANVMYTITPIPLDVARIALMGYFIPPKNITTRIREEHPNDLDAKILSAVIDSLLFDNHTEAFAQVKNIISIADTDEKKHKLFMAYQQLWQVLTGDDALECERLLVALSVNNPSFSSTFNAMKDLREKRPDEALQLLDEQKTEDDTFSLQLRANAYIQKRQIDKAVTYLSTAAFNTFDPVLLRKTAGLAFQSGIIDIAVECFEMLAIIYPSDKTIRSNLASIYINDLHDIEKAAIQMRALHVIEPNNPLYSIELAMCLAHLYHPQESLAIFNEACAQNKPELRAILGRSELYFSLGDPVSALASLKGFKELYSNDPSFQLTIMNTAYAAGDDAVAGDALLIINRLNECGAIKSDMFKSMTTDEGLEIFKKNIKDTQDRSVIIHNEMLKGRMPWVWAEQISGNAIYLAWHRRTQEIGWLGDDPVTRASYSIYSTNAFHPQNGEDGVRSLSQLDCPPKGTKIVADISALITLHRLGLLDQAGDYFGNIIVPAGYLPYILDDGKRMVMHQRSQQRILELLLKFIADEKIKIADKTDDNTAIVDEYRTSTDHRYHLIDLINPMFADGLIGEDVYKLAISANFKTSNIIDNYPALNKLQTVFIEVSSLDTITRWGLLDITARYYSIYVDKESNSNLKQQLNAIRFQEETRNWHFDLWNKICNDHRFAFVPHTVPDNWEKKDSAQKDNLPFYGFMIANRMEIPLLVDDRSCQVVACNMKPNVPFASFGTDGLIVKLDISGIINTSRAAEMLLQMMKWRYKFILPNKDILKALLLQYRTNLPGYALKEVAEYIHDCMHDAGLFGGIENTTNPDSMATRLFISWVSVITELIIVVWDDDTFSIDSAKRFTEWCINVLLPSSPGVIPAMMKVNVSSLTSKMIISHYLTNTCSSSNTDRVSAGILAIKDAFKLTDDEYYRIITDALNVASKTEL